MTAPSAGKVRVGVDIGGTFTDFIVLAQDSGRFRIGKRLTTPGDPSRAVLDGLAEILQQQALQPGDVSVVVHATTLVTNTVIERTGAAVGLIATQGCRDVLEIGTESRYDLYDLFLRMPEPLVPRYLRKTIEERLGPGGVVLRPLARASAERAIRELLDEGVEAIAVALLHSYADPVHELQVLDLVREQSATIPVTLSSALIPEIREYERTLAAVMNAYVQPKVRDYIARLTAGLEHLGVGAPLYVMQSNGGLTIPDRVVESPVGIIESGPAAGAVFATYAGKAIGLERLVSFDMGGTTAKTCLITEGTPSVTVDIEVARLERFKKGSGFPIRIPSIELIEVGAGGGSIAWIDALGLLKVGPRSASANPGPACYGLGGSEPTVTDADLLLGYLDPAYFLGGEMALDIAAAEAAMARVADPLGLSTVEAAWGIHDIVNETMALASRTHIIERDEDPRRFALIAFGGAGPVHAQGVAAKLGVSRLIFPVAAGAASALGLLVARPSAEYVQSYVDLLDHCDWERVERLYSEMEARGKAVLAGITSDGVATVRTLDCRYAGQGYDLNVEMPAGRLSAEAVPDIEERFHSVYERRYGRRMRGAQLAVMNLRTSTLGPAPALSPARAAAEREPPTGMPVGARAAYFGPAHGFTACAVYRRHDLRAGQSAAGPAIIEERESTIVVAPGQRWNVDDAGNIILELASSPA